MISCNILFKIIRDCEPTKIKSKMAAPTTLPALLEKLQNADKKVPVLEELKTYVTATSRDNLREAADDIFYDVF